MIEQHDELSHKNDIGLYKLLFTLEKKIANKTKCLRDAEQRRALMRRHHNTKPNHLVLRSIVRLTLSNNQLQREIECLKEEHAAIQQQLANSLERAS